MAVRSWAQAGKMLLTENFRAPKNVCIRLKPVFGITMVYSHNIWGQRHAANKLIIFRVHDFLWVVMCRGIHCSRPVFAGHSKWKNIQHRKGAQDLKRMRVSMRLVCMGCLLTSLYPIYLSIISSVRPMVGCLSLLFVFNSSYRLSPSPSLDIFE